MPLFRRRLALAAGLLMLFVLAGCRGAAAPASVEGEVRYQGELVQQGTIRFFPDAGTPGQGAGANIVDGHYSIGAEAGLVVGSYRVALTALRPTGRQIAREDTGQGDGGMVDEVEQYLPAEYNEQLTLTRTLDAGENQVNFTLE